MAASIGPSHVDGERLLGNSQTSEGGVEHYRAAAATVNE